MMTSLTIHRKSGDITVGVNQGSIRRYNLMTEDFIRLKFSLAENTPLSIGDYVDLTEYLNSCDNEKFRIKDERLDQTTKLFILDRNYYPTFNKETGGWDYDVQINAYYHLWKNRVFMYNPSKGAAESSFSLTDSIDVHAKLIEANLREAGLKWDENTEYSVEIHSEAKTKGMKPITYSALSIYSAIGLIAQTFECEWWLDGRSTIHFGVRKNNTSAELKLNEEIADASISDSDGTHATRIYPFGGTTNIPKHYRKKLVFEANDILSESEFRDKSKPIKATWFPDIYREEPKTLEFGKDTIVSDNGSCSKSYSVDVKGGNIDAEVKGLRVNFYPVRYGYYSIDGATPKVDVETKLNVIEDIVLNRQMITLPQLETYEGEAVSGDFMMGIKIDSEGQVFEDPYLSSPLGTWRFPISQGECFSICYRFGANTINVGFAESIIGGGSNIEPVWSFTNSTLDTKCVYYKAQRDGYVYCGTTTPQGLPTVKKVLPIGVKLFNNDYHFSRRTSDDWGNVSIIVDAEAKGLDGDIAFAYEVSLNNFSIETQRLDYAARTKMRIGGEEYDVIVNPNFSSEEIGHTIKSPYYEVHAKDAFTLPNIIVGRVNGDYFMVDDEVVRTGVVHRNVMMPETSSEDVVNTDAHTINYERGYVQAKGVNDDEVIEAIMVYDWIYPKTEINITGVDPVNYEVSDDEEGEKSTITTYNITAAIKNFSDEMVVDGNLYCIFQPSYNKDGEQVSRMSGLRFEVEYPNKGGADEVVFKLIPNEDYADWLPNEVAYPQVGDKIVLEGIDVSFIETNAIGRTEVEVLNQALSDMSSLMKEDKVVDITLTPTYSYDTGRLELGSQLSLVNVLSSEDSAYHSRILGFEECLDIPWDKPKYIVGDSNYYSRTASIETKLENIEKGSITLGGMSVGGGGSSVKIIKNGDNTKPTDSNVYSALRSRDEFVKRNEDDTINGNISIKKSLSVDGDATFGGDADVNGNHTIGGNQSIQGTQSVQGQATFHSGARGDGYTEQGDIIQGWNIGKDGIASFAKVKTPSMQVYELTLNRKTAVQGEFVFSDGEVVENVEFLGADTYRLTVRALYEGYITTFKVNDILYSNINIIGSSAKTGKCWMYVTAVDGNKITAVHYPYEACPAGENINPVPYMTITRHGNITDKTRQDLFIISSEASSLTMLRGVSAPIVSSEGLYGVVIGKLPATLLEYIHKAGIGYVNGEDPYVYARGVIVQDLIMLDYKGKPIVQERYRGKWRQEIANGLVEGEDTYQATTSVADTVTYEGSLWRCNVTGTTVPPKDGIAEWQKKVSKGDDSTAVIYTLKPSSNIVYYRTASNTLSVDELNVKVSVAGNGEYYDIADQNTIEQAGLSVYYALDGEGEPILLNISPDGEILLEDGSGFIESEDGSDLLLEGEVLDITKIKDNITLYLKDLETGEMRASYVIPVIKDGEEGKQGRMLYPAGEWNKDTTYAIENNSAPFVKKGNTYYVLVYEGGAVTNIDPVNDVANNGGYWKQFTYMNYLFAEFLMANWAMFGTEGKGGIFYDKYLFSQKVIKDDGEEDNYNKGIFDSNGKLSGAVPKLMLDFVNGNVHTTNLIEQYRKQKRYSVIRVTPSEGFNIYIPSDVNDSDSASWSFRMRNPMVILPSLGGMGLEDYEIEGSHVTITFGLGGGKYATLMNNNSGHIPAENEFLLVCVDDACITPDEAEGFANKTYYTNIAGNVAKYGFDNFIFHGGRRGKYVMMSPGSTLKLRPYIVNEGTGGNRIYWMIEGTEVYEKNLTVYHTAYSLPTKSVYPSNSIKVTLHNNTGEKPYKYTNDGTTARYEVYAGKTLLKGASATDEQNLTDESNGYQYGICFACGLISQLPDKIIISAHCDENGVRVNKDNEKEYNYYHFRAFDPANDTDNIKQDT